MYASGTGDGEDARWPEHMTRAGAIAVGPADNVVMRRTAISTGRLSWSAMMAARLLQLCGTAHQSGRRRLEATGIGMWETNLRETNSIPTKR